MTDYSTLRKLVWEDVFMVRSENGVTTFSHPALPHGVHFSISHHEDHEYWNLHVSRNAGDDRNKPKIEICRIKQANLLDHLPGFMQHFAFALLEPVSRLAGRYIDTKDLQTGKQFARLRKSMATHFNEHSGRKGKKEFRIHKTLQDGLTTRPEIVHKILRNLKKIPNRFQKRSGGGIMISQNECTPLIVINHKPYRFKPTSEFDSTLARFIAPGLLDRLEEKMLSAILLVSTAETYAEVEAYDEGIEIFVQLVQPDTIYRP
jgi:hypothetical protein